MSSTETRSGILKKLIAAAKQERGIIATRAHNVANKLDGEGEEEVLVSYIDRRTNPVADLRSFDVTPGVPEIDKKFLQKKARHDDHREFRKKTINELAKAIDKLIESKKTELETNIENNAGIDEMGARLGRGEFALDILGIP